MKLKYNIQIQKLGKIYIGVAVGKDAESFSDILRLNDTMQDIVQILKDDVSHENVIHRMLDKYNTDEATMTEYVDSVLDMLQNYNLLKM